MKNYISAILLGLIQIPLLVSVFFLNYSGVFSFKYSMLFWIIIIIYAILILLYFIFTRIFKISSIKFLEESAISSLIFIILLFPGLFIANQFMISTQDRSNILLRVTGRIGFFYLALVLTISPILILLKNKWSNILIMSRKYIGILAFLFYMKHNVDYFLMEHDFYQLYYTNQFSFIQYVIHNIPARYDVIIGLFAGVIMIILGVTSNNFSYKFFGKAWKGIHYLIYPLFLITMVHIAFTGRFDIFYASLFILVVGLRFLIFIKDYGKSKTVQSGPTTKYICLVCGYIYDENVGDPDGGLPPGTKFEDIPDTRVCPVCKVTKKDFAPYYDGSSSGEEPNESTVISINYLTKDVIEMIVVMKHEVNTLPGQFIKFILKDFDGEFARSYSIAEIKGNEYKFMIKIKENGRGGRFLKTVQAGNKIKVGGAYGSFVIKHTKNPKVFIATGTGLSPVYNMMNSLPAETKKVLYFGVAKKEDLFYEQELQKIPGIEINYFLSREEVEGYNYGRISLKDYDMDTEFYICGNPDMTQQMVDNLEGKGHENVYFEKFI